MDSFEKQVREVNVVIVIECAIIAVMILCSGIGWGVYSKNWYSASLLVFAAFFCAGVCMSFIYILTRQRLRTLTDYALSKNDDQPQINSDLHAAEFEQREGISIEEDTLRADVSGGVYFPAGLVGNISRLGVCSMGLPEEHAGEQSNE